MNFIGIIPARYASTRFPGKPLVDIGGKSMIQRVYEQSAKVLADVVVATDDERIQSAVVAFGGNVVMTSTEHKSGTDRCAEAIEKYEQQTGKTFDVAVNIQGDEPFIQPQQLEKIISCFDSSDTQIATLVKKFGENDDIFNVNHPKVILNKHNEAIYFSRSVIPFFRGIDAKEWTKHHTYFKHIGIYAYRKNVLHEITKLAQSSLEIAESLEQNRWIENGYKIKVAITKFESISIDTIEDLKLVKNLEL